MLGAIFDKISKTNKNVLDIFNETKHEPLYYNAPVPSSVLTTVLDISGEGYIDNITCISTGRPTLKITIDGVVKFLNTAGSSNLGSGVIGIVRKDGTNAVFSSTGSLFVLSPHINAGAYFGAGTPAATNLKSYPYITAGAEDRPICLVPQNIRFRSSLKIEVANNVGIAYYTISGGLKV